MRTYHYVKILKLPQVSFILLKIDLIWLLYILFSNCLNVHFFSCINLFTSQNQELD